MLPKDCFLLNTWKVEGRIVEGIIEIELQHADYYSVQYGCVSLFVSIYFTFSSKSTSFLIKDDPLGQVTHYCLVWVLFITPLFITPHYYSCSTEETLFHDSDPKSRNAIFQMNLGWVSLVSFTARNVIFRSSKINCLLWKYIKKGNTWTHILT